MKFVLFDYWKLVSEMRSDDVKFFFVSEVYIGYEIVLKKNLFLIIFIFIDNFLLIKFFIIYYGLIF